MNTVQHRLEAWTARQPETRLSDLLEHKSLIIIHQEQNAVNNPNARFRQSLMQPEMGCTVCGLGRNMLQCRGEEVEAYAVRHSDSFPGHLCRGI